jgi:uncharacterized membrane protein YfcA
MLAGVPNLAMLVAVGVAFVAALARGFSGFGSALIFVPIGSAMLGPHIAVPLLLIVDGVMTLPMVPAATRHCHWRDVLLMVLGGSLGVPLGTAILTHADPVAMRWAISVLILVLLVVLASGWRYRARPAPPVTTAVGLGAGILSGAAQVGGPPVVVYWLGGSIAAATVRANLIVYFVLSTVLTVAAYLVGGLLSSEVLGAALVAAPVYGLGLWLGSRLFGLASDTVFRRACYSLIALSALASLPALDGLWRR